MTEFCFDETSLDFLIQFSEIATKLRRVFQMGELLMITTLPKCLDCNKLLEKVGGDIEFYEALYEGMLVGGIGRLNIRTTKEENKEGSQREKISID